jgi:hypothetical protein
MRAQTIPLLAATALLAGGAAAATAPAETRAATSYRMDVHLEPAAGSLDCRVEILHPGSPEFSLSPDMAVRRILADGREVAFAARPGAGAEGAQEIIPAGATPLSLVVEYGGRLRADSYPRLVSQVNLIRPELVELAGYVGWYPRLKASAPFSFRLRVEAPHGFVTVTNGRLVGETAGPGNGVSEWSSDAPVWDVVLIAAPRLRRTASERAGTSVEVYSSALPAEYVAHVSDDVARAVEVVARIVGAPPPTHLVRLVYSPRPGWGYVRKPLIVVSEASALAARDLPFGPARDLRYVTHEIAHYWWHQGDTSTPEDWINEGLAEYTALLASEQLVGREFAELLLREYEERSRDSVSATAIVETQNGSPDREVNRYARPVLFLNEARRRYGPERTTAFLQALYRRFEADGRATTASFLETAASSLGPEAGDAFREALRRKSWGEASGPYRISVRDTAFLGTWTGPLTQAGSTNAVVLHLDEKEGVLVASLDSPDQGVKGIPVPSLRVSGDALHFGLGNVGVSFEGRLDRDADAIDGTWTQGGVACPLHLVRATESAASP